MDVTPKSKQPGSLKRRPSSLSRSTRTKLLKTEGASPPPGKSEILEETNEATVPTPEQQCTPVRQLVKNEMSPQYPHLFPIYHDESPEFRVGWDDGVSENLPRKAENVYFESSFTSRAIISQHMRRSTKRISTPPRLKQRIKTTDVLEYMQWTKNLIKEAQTPSPSELLAANAASEKETDDSGCDMLKNAVSSKETGLLSRRSLPVSTINAKENLELNRKSLPPESNYANFFDDSTNDDMFMKCSQAVEESLLKNKQTDQICTASKTVNNNNINPKKGAQPKQFESNSINRPNAASSQSLQEVKSNLINSNTVSSNKFPSQSATVSKKVQGASTVNVKPLQHISTSVKPVLNSAMPAKASNGHNVLSKTESSPKEFRTDIQLLDEDEEFLSSLDLQSLSQLNPPQSAITSNKNVSGGCSTSNSSVSNQNVIVNTRNINTNAVKANQNVPPLTTNRSANSAPVGSNISDYFTNPGKKASANAGNICTQEAIKRKREEAQRRLRLKMNRHASL